MNDHLKQFTNHTAYNAVKDNLDRPNVVLCTLENEIHYNPVDYGGHDYVEIGGIKWATMNLGANSVTDNGLYFAWGETEGYTASQVGTAYGQRRFTWNTYKYRGNGYGGQTKYNSTDQKTTLEASDDAVITSWGGPWRMPTDEDFRTLLNSTTVTQTSNYKGSNVAGWIFTSNSDATKEIFFPAAGMFNDTEYVGNARYWTNFHDVRYQDFYSTLLVINSTSLIWVSDLSRCFGCSIRPVAD